MILAGTHPGPALERAREIALIGEADHVGDLRLGVITLAEIALGETAARILKDVAIARAFGAELALQCDRRIFSDSAKSEIGFPEVKLGLFPGLGGTVRTPRMIGLAVYRLDINFRESAVVGIVGGGGIGATLLTAFDRYEFDSAAAILVIIIAIVMAMEYCSGYLRKWVQ